MFPELYIIFAPKMPEFYMIIVPKIFFPNFRVHVPPNPRYPVSYASAVIFRANIM